MREMSCGNTKVQGTLEPLVLQGNAEVDREGEIETKSQSHSEDDREEDKGKGNGKGVHTE